LPRLLVGALRLSWQSNRRGFVGAATLQVLGGVTASLLVLIGKWALDGLLAVGKGGAPLASLVLGVVALAALVAIGSAATTFQQQQQRLLSEDLSRTVWDRLLDVTTRVGLAHYESARFYDQLQRVRDNSITQPMLVTSALFGLIGSTVTTAGLMVALVTIQPLLVPVLLLGGIPTVLIGRRASRAEFRFATRIVSGFRAREYLRRVLTGRDEAKEIRAFGAERALRSRCDQRSDQFRRDLRAHVRVRQAYALLGVASSTVALAGALGVLVWFLHSGRISLGGAAAAVLAVRMLSSGLDTIFRSVNGLLQSAVFLADMESFLDLTHEAESDGTGVAPPFRRGVRVEDVSYTYPGSTQPALDGVRMQLGPGEVVAVVGENGSGKTTLAKLLGGLYQPDDGQITWDGVSTADLEPADVRRGVSVIFQDFVRYQLSALDNIGLGSPDQAEDEAAARDAAERAGADGFLSPLPDGYQTILSKEYEGGRELSLGQWQRVALARALRRDAGLVILDEPSAALDPRAEHALFEDIRRTLNGRAALLISHRYSTVRSADRIYVMRDGHIAESGSHAELMCLGGLYSELFTLQASAYQH